MPANNVTINLLGESDMEHTPMGRIIGWAITYGRYIMIGTEIVVLLAFISRFSLDRKLTDLKEEVSQKQNIIQANQDFEKDIRALQDKLAKIKALRAQPNTAIPLLQTFQTILPSGMYLKSLNMEDGRVTVAAVAGSTGAFAQFIANIQNAKTLSNIEIGDIARDPILGIQFVFSAAIPNAVAAKPK
jgi:Tfp pilus assembly protein PilN